jgi:transcription factor IIIB subunit 2
MLQKRSKQFSNHINYDRLKELFPGGNIASSPSGTDSGQGASPAASHAVQTPPVIQIPADEDAEGEDDDEEHYAEEEEEYDEDGHHYMAEEEGGFGNDYDDDY